MSNAVFLIRNQIDDEIFEHREARCYSITTNRGLGLTINPYPINEDDILESNGMIPEQFEESLDDHEKLLDLLDDSGCKFHSARATLEKFKKLGTEFFHDEKLHDPAQGRVALSGEDLNALTDLDDS